MQNKRGQSLVEVVVALSILMIVITTTMSLLVGVIGLITLSRNTTEATAFAQQGIADGKMTLGTKCSAINGKPSEAEFIAGSTTGNVENIPVGTDTPFNLKVDIAKYSQSYSGGVSISLYEVISTVSWNDKFKPDPANPNTLSLVELVKNGN